MYRFFSILLIGVLALGFTSCSDDEPTSGKKPSYVITSITTDEGSCNVNYDSHGRIIGGTGVYFGWVDFSYTYSDNTILCQHPKEPEDDSTFNVDGGLVVNFENEGRIRYNYVYAGKELKSMGWVGSDDSITLTWADGLIVSSYEAYEGVKKAFEYTSIDGIQTAAVKTLNAIAISEEVEDEYPWPFAIFGLMGNVPEKPISKIGSAEIKYGPLDSNGCPSSFSIDDATYNLTWKKL